MLDLSMEVSWGNPQNKQISLRALLIGLFFSKIVQEIKNMSNKTSFYYA